MNRGLKVSALAMEALLVSQDIIANNLANVNTTAFKPDVVVYKSFPSIFSKVLGELKGGVTIDEITSRFEEGSLIKTEGTFDFALRGDGFFVIQTPEGERYTRSGNFVLDSVGQLSTPQGYPVLGEGGPITITGNNVQISDEGDIYVDGTVVDRLKIVDFPHPYTLKKVGHNLFAPKNKNITPGNKPKNTKVLQGFLEASVVRPVKEMVQMIEILRIFEANQKVLFSQDEMLKKAVTEVGKA